MPGTEAAFLGVYRQRAAAPLQSIKLVALVYEHPVPQFQHDEADDLFAEDELAGGAHVFEKAVDLLGIEVAAFLDGVFVEGVGDEVLELGLVEEVFDGEIEGDLLAAGDVRGEDFVGEFALDVFVGLAVDLEMRGHLEREVDEAVIEEGKAILKAVRHGVLVLTDQGPVLEPLVVLELEQAVEERAVLVLLLLIGHPGFGGEVLELVAVGVAAFVLAPEGAKGIEVVIEVALRVVAEEVHDALLALAAEVGREDEGLVQDSVRDRLKGEGTEGGRAGKLATELLHLGDDTLERVARKGLVRAFAAEHDLEVFTRALGEFVERDQQGIADGAVHVPDDLRQQIKVLGLADDFVMIRAEEFGGFTRGGRLIHRGIKADGVGVDVG